MENDVAVELLNGMPLVTFKKWYILAMAGAFLYLLIRIIIVLSPIGGKPPKWSWRVFFKGFLKLLITAVGCPLIILYFDSFAPFIIEILFTTGSTNAAGAEHQHIIMELNGLSAAGLGFSMDFIIHKTIKKIQERRNGNVSPPTI